MCDLEKNQQSEKERKRANIESLTKPKITTTSKNKTKAKQTNK